MKKKKIAKIMRKQLNEFVSAQFRCYLLVSPFGYYSDVLIWCKPMTDAVHVWHSAAFFKLQVMYTLWLIPLGLAALWMSQAALKS